MLGVARRPKIGIEISISVSGSIEPKAETARQIPLSDRPTPPRDNSGRFEIVPRYLASAEVGKTTKLQKQHCTSALE
jgi:hypothetical protein